MSEKIRADYIKPEVTKHGEIPDDFLASIREQISTDTLTGRKNLALSAEQQNKMTKLVRSTLLEIFHKRKMAEAIDRKNLMECEFELEEEIRLMVDPKNIEIKEWVNHVVDTYDESGRMRIRDKNGSLRLSIKIPLKSKDTKISKACIREEIKPVTAKQEKEFELMRQILLKEPGTQVQEKWGTPLKLKNGQKIWINKDAQGNHWVESDVTENIEDLLPEGLEIIGYKKSRILIDKNQADKIAKEKLKDFSTYGSVFLNNIETLSRTAKTGKVDTSVSKEKAGFYKENVKEQVAQNMNDLANFIWQKKDLILIQPKDIQGIVKEIAEHVNKKIYIDDTIPKDKFREHEVKYGRKVKPEDVPAEMEKFYQVLAEKIQAVGKNMMEPWELAAWVEIEINRNIHPYLDGCGRISQALSSYILAYFNSPQPQHSSRDEYYQAMNNDDPNKFMEYFKKAIDKSNLLNYSA